jgi:hypothetical protein
MRRFLPLIVAITACVGCGQDPGQHSGTGGSTRTKVSGKMLSPAFPVAEGKYQLTDDWSIMLPDKFSRRIEDGSLVLWKPGITVWVVTFNNDHGESKETRLENIRKVISKDSFDVQVMPEKDILRFAYRLKEQADDGRVAAFYGFAFGAEGHVQLGIYFNDEKELELAKKLWLSLDEQPKTVKHN